MEVAELHEQIKLKDLEQEALVAAQQESYREKELEQQLAEAQATVVTLGAELASIKTKLERAEEQVSEETIAREAAELECTALEEALGEEMAQLEEQCTAAELESEESQKKAASFELQIAEARSTHMRAEKKSQQTLKDVKRQLAKEHDTREGLEKALEKQMSLGGLAGVSSPDTKGNKKLKQSDFIAEAENILKDCTPKTLAAALMEKAKCDQQNDELKSQLELNAIRIRFVEENNALLMKDMDTVQDTMKLNEELMKAKMTLEDQVEDLTEREATKSRMLKDYISSQSQTTPKGSKRRGN